MSDQIPCIAIATPEEDRLFKYLESLREAEARGEQRLLSLRRPASGRTHNADFNSNFASAATYSGSLWRTTHG